VKSAALDAIEKGHRVYIASDANITLRDWDKATYKLRENGVRFARVQKIFQIQHDHSTPPGQTKIWRQLLISTNLLHNISSATLAWPWPLFWVSLGRFSVCPLIASLSFK